MADSDSGTHISDITENNAEELEVKQQDHLQSISELTTTKTISFEDLQKTEENTELNNVKNTMAREENDRIPNTFFTTQTRQNTDPNQTESQSKQERKSISVQGHRTQRFNPQSINGGIHVTTAHVHSAPHTYREINGDLSAATKRKARRQRSLPPTWSQLRGIENNVLDTSFENLQENRQVEPRADYNFIDVEIKPKRAAVIGMDMNYRDDSQDDGDAVEEASWAPTGIFAVFVITLWTAVLKLIDSIEQNGPVICSEGEEVRLWICAGCLSFVFGLTEITWKNKSLLQALLGTILVFTYMMVGHTEPLSCRLGQGKLTEIGKWQAAMNFFLAALLGTRVYQEIADSIRQKRKKRKETKHGRKKRAEQNESGDENSSAMGVYRM